MSLTEEATREIERYLTLAPEMVILAGFDGYWKRVNPSVEAILGYSQAEALSRPFMEFVHPDDRKRTEEEARSVVEGATALAFANRMLCKDGSVKWIEWTATPVPEEAVMWGVGRDVTERRRTETQQAALRRIATLVAKDVESSELFAVVAEEVGRVVDAPLVAVARYESEDTATVYGQFPSEAPLYSTGDRVSLEGVSVLGRIRANGEPSRIDDYKGLPGDVAESARANGIVSGVGVPIVVAGDLWGSIVAWSRQRLPEDFESRLAEFTELVAAAIANAEATEALTRLADEQAALRRVATLVAEGTGPEGVFRAVAGEVGALFGSDVSAIVRFVEDGKAIVLGDIGGPHESGKRVSLDPGYVVDQVRQTRRSARFDTDDPSAAGHPSLVHAIGIRSAVASPIVVEGELWGAITAASVRGSLAAGAERHLTEFTELVATAVSNAQARDALAGLVDEQAALRRVATLVADEGAPDRVFTAVCEQVGQLLGADVAVMEIFPGDDTGRVLAGWHTDGASVPIGAQLTLLPDSIGARILSTGATVRQDDPAAMQGGFGELARDLQLHSAVGAPILVSNRIWGAVIAGTRDGGRWAEEAEERLAAFTQLVATAIGNAESHDALARLADEQAALRRVATLVAQGTPPAELFTAVSQEVGRLFGSDLALVTRFDAEGPAAIVMGVATELEAVPVGSRWELEEGLAAGRVYQTGLSARIDSVDRSELKTEIGAVARRVGIASTVACPIQVGGRLWGTITVPAYEPLPPDTEDRLEKFTEVVAVAIANSDSRDAVARLAEEQAALRRVATLVAEGATTTRLAASVLDEVVAALDVPAAWLVRYEPERTMSILGSINDPSFPVGSRWPLEGTSVSSVVFETGESARIDDFTGLEGAIAARSRESGFLSSLGVPIVVDGTVWGAICVGTPASEPLPPDMEDRLDRFTELVATAISNADARDHLHGLADEQAALRRVATLVAHDAPSAKVMEAVAAEVGELLDANLTVLGRYDDDGAATALGSWSSSPEVIPVGTRSAIGGHNVLSIVAETGGPARLDDYEDATGEAAEIARAFGWRSSIAAPITVEGGVWGVMLVATQSEEPFPEGDEERLAQFTDLVATAVANAQSHDAVRQFGEEQAALGRVATLVAGGAAPEQVFSAVVEEASSLLGFERIELVRYDGDTTGTVMAASGDHPFPAGSAWSLDDPSVMAAVARTASAARIDDYGTLEGEIASAARSAGFRSAIGAPVTVEGRLWGAIIAISTDPEPIPERSEARLAQFTELVATAVANAESRDALALLADEQAALRRVATLVAEGSEPAAVFSSVGKEISRMLGAPMSAVGRFESGADGTSLVIVGIGTGDAIETGSRWRPEDLPPVARVLTTERSVRMDEIDWSAGGPVAEVATQVGVVSIVASPIFVEGRLWGVMTACDTKLLPAEAELRLEKFSELIATAIGNAETSAELAASRRRIVTAGDEARRRIERDLHDGIQQRLIALSFRARAMTRKPPAELPAVAEELSEDIKDVTDELREVSRGIHPTILTEAGLGPALRALARRSDIPIHADVRVHERLPEPIEAAAYYIVSEALTNVAKHAHANAVELSARRKKGFLTLEVRDDGVGGVDLGRGSGVVGLTDRAEALGGTISIVSPPNEGTTLSVRLPIAT
jgi:PAS domain S-box-containing protein